ncbi:zinc ABC transporter substrate-binding protein [Antarctobacter jejuensis]|uniref:zinc ABC transporter substrate-binding protein n=1 Tax=Antarctobacter jejuensis TaxID=1439938 RepID=UPI003FCF17F0
MLRPLFLSLCLALPHAALSDAPRVVTDIGPVSSLVAMVTGEVTSPEGLLPPGASPHEMALRPSQARALSNADLVVWVGPALTPGLDHQIEMLAPKARKLALQEVDGTHHLQTRDTGLFEHEHDDHDDHTPDEDHHEDHADGIDPHLWLDPDNATLWLSAIAEALSEKDPENAEAYRANAQAGAAAISAASAEAEALLKDGKTGPFAAAHDAFQYFEARFGLRVSGALSDAEATPSGPARLAALRDALAAQPPACVFIEPGTDLRLVASIVGDVPVAELDALGSSLPQGAALYPALIRDFAQRIAACGTG